MDVARHAPEAETGSGGGTTSEPRGQPEYIELETLTRRGDVIAGLFCLVGGLIGYFFVVPAAVFVPTKFAGTVNSPAFLPNALFLILIGLSAVYLVQSLAAYLREQTQGRVRASDWLLAGGTAAICIGYVAAIYIIGMTIASGLSVAIAMYYFGERRFWVIGLVAVILPAALWYFFVKIAHILFPVPVFGVPGWLEMASLFDGAAEQVRLTGTLIG